MKVVGLTGGIGSGKSTVANIFKALGYSVFNSDLFAKKCYEFLDVKQKVERLLGAEIYLGDQVNYKAISNIVFNDQQKLRELNEIIHPCVQDQFETWIKTRKGSFVLKEAAILVESGAYKNCDVVISVEASESLRIHRIINRDHLRREEIIARMSNQMTAEQRSHYADFVIWNENDFILPQILEIIQKLEN